jgi:hypothetical protein
MRRITGVQLHHSIKLADASAALANAGSSLNAAYRATGDPYYLALSDQCRALGMEVGRAHEAARTRLIELRETRPDLFEEAREGFTPWPDENDDVELRCNCYDQCLHRFGIDIGPNGVCNCPENKRPCPRHPEDND